MSQEYTPPGSANTFTVPAYSDVVDGPVAFKAFADDVAAGIDVKAPTDSPIFTGTTTVVSPTATGSTGARQITISTAAPTGGVDGDLWVVYVP